MGTRSVAFSALVLTLMALPQAAAAKAPVNGDFNGDGTADLAISSPRYPNGDDPVGPGSVNVLYAAAHGHPLLGGSLWSQSTPGIKGSPDPEGEFGHSLATGDFDGDGKADLAIGAPTHARYKHGVSQRDHSGSVSVLYGSRHGITATGDQLFTPLSPGIPRASIYSEQLFGAALAAGDFDGDGRDDLAISAPGDGPGSGSHASGVVFVLFGSPSGLRTSRLQKWTLARPHIHGGGDVTFGFELAAGDFDHDGADDLAVTEWEWDLPHPQGGRVNVLYGVKGHGLSWHRNQLWSQASPGIKGVPEAVDDFGQALATGDFDGDHYADLAIGVPGEGPDSGGSGPRFGAAEVIYGSRHGLTATGNQLWSLRSPGVPGAPQLDDELGTALAAGDFNGDGRDELVVGSWHATVDGQEDAGELFVLRGSKRGLTAQGSRLWTVDTAGVPGNKTTDPGFGGALATGDFDADGRDDLAVGAGATVHGKSYAGAVDVLFGTKDGLGVSRVQRLTRATPGVAGNPQYLGGFGDTIQ